MRLRKKTLKKCLPSLTTINDRLISILVNWLNALEGDVRFLITSIAFAIGGILCAIACAACSRGENGGLSNRKASLEAPSPKTSAASCSNSSGGSGVRIQRIEGLTPDEAFVIVRDLNGFFDDCGCGGPVRGGVARMPAAAQGIGKVHFIFIGNTTIPAPASLTGPAAEPTQLRKRAAFAAEVLRALPSVSIISGSDEWEFLATKLDTADLDPLKKYIKEKLVIADSSVRFTSDDLDIGGGADTASSSGESSPRHCRRWGLARHKSGHALAGSKSRVALAACERPSRNQRPVDRAAFVDGAGGFVLARSAQC